jgi:cystathionine gamma-synthase
MPSSVTNLPVTGARPAPPLVAHPATMTHAAMDPVACQTAGLVDGLPRPSVGIEALEDLQADLAAGLKRAEAVLPKHQREATAA